MIEILSAHAGAILLVIAALGSLALAAANWEAFCLWAQSSWDSTPLVGGIARLARSGNAAAGSERPGTGNASMLALCSNYAKFIRVLSRADYENYMNYLRKAGDLGRSPFPPSLWFVIFSMIVIEAAGLAYVLAGWTMPGASEVIQQLTAAGIGFLIAVILVFFTHWSGVEIYQWNQYRRDRDEWNVAGREGSLFGKDLSLNDPQHLDDDAPDFRQRATRGHGAKSIFLTTVTVMMMIAIGVGAAFVRGQVLEQELNYEVSGRVRSTERFDLSLPDKADKVDKAEKAAAAARASTEKQLAEQEVLIKRRGGWGTLTVLVVIFFFLQLLGMFFGYRYSFNGRLSKDAYRALKASRFSSYNELMQYYDRIADIAQGKIERLRHLVEQRQSGLYENPETAAPFSFRDFVRNRNQQRRDLPLTSLDAALPEEAPATLRRVRPAAAPEKPATVKTVAQKPAAKATAQASTQAAAQTHGAASNARADNRPAAAPAAKAGAKPDAKPDEMPRPTVTGDVYAES